MKKTCLLAFALSLVPATGLANPLMIVQKLSAEVTGNTHVRIRYVSNYGASKPYLETIYGTSQSDWFTTGETYSADTGSGVQTMTYYYRCDCHVPTGSPLTYSVSGSSMGPASNLSATLTPAPADTTLCDTQCASADSRDAGADANDTRADAMPDTLVASDAGSGPADRPEDSTPIIDAGAAPDVASVVDTGFIPSHTGGAGATGGAAATGGTAGSVGSQPVDAGSIPQGSDQESSSGGCAMASKGAGAPALLFALGLLVLGLRRRR